ncbi:MAG: aminotransferase class I/II-fold pyridoxal phosphate-dependent enzyme [Oscillospiraceae bacterium]|nr:aminotransferase class I/II-fold pyridoxal phosphate-dependent enzyme [Oscillospiraceae bacterium]
MSDHISLATPHMSDEGYELAFIHDAFQKNWIAPLGENVDEFENSIKTYIGTEHVVALSSGTAALHLALILSGAGKGDRVFCQDLTFSASANPITYVGAEPVFIDSERDTWNMDPAALRKAIALYGIPKAVIVVHLYGNPAKMAEICEICDAYHITVIEDAAEALGSVYNGQKCGSFGKYGILSFNGNKIITTSGGGVLLCKEEDDARHALKLATQAREPFPWYQHEEIGYNYRLSNISAGIGRGQMKVLANRMEQKRAIYLRYRENLAGLPLTLQPMQENMQPNFWLTTLLIDENADVTPMQVIDALTENDIESRPLWKPMHAQPVYADKAYVTVGDESVSDSLFRRGLCLPSDTKMSMDDVGRVCKIIRSIF